MKPKIIIAVLLLLIIVFISVVPRKKYEYFESLNPITALAGDSTQSYYYRARSLTEFDNNVSQNFNAMVDYTTSMLLMKRCYAMREKLLQEFENDIRDPVYIKKISVYTNDFADVEQKILDALIEFADRQPTGKIKGDVYVLISQQPYYRNADGTEISLDSTTINERHNYNTPKYTGKAVIDDHPIYYSVILFFAAYGIDGSYMACKDGFYRTMQLLDQNNVSNENQCFITCANNDNKFCGCATGTAPGASDDNKTAAREANTTPYDSMCLGINADPNDKTKITPTTYFILYIVNQNYKINYDMSRIFDMSDTCKLVNNALPTDPVLRANLRI